MEELRKQLEDILEHNSFVSMLDALADIANSKVGSINHPMYNYIARELTIITLGAEKRMKHPEKYS